MHTDNRLPEEPTVYVRVGSGFLVVKLTVGEILKYLVWHENDQAPFYVKCPKCGKSGIAMVEWWNSGKLFEGKLKVNCPHKEVYVDVHPGKNAHFLRKQSLISALRESYRPRVDELMDRKLTEFLDLSSQQREPREEM